MSQQFDKTFAILWRMLLGLKQKLPCLQWLCHRLLLERNVTASGSVLSYLSNDNYKKIRTILNKTAVMDFLLKQFLLYRDCGLAFYGATAHFHRL